MKVSRAIFYTLFAIASSSRDVTGYDIILILRHISVNRLKMGPSTVYPTLKKLKHVNWIQEIRSQPRLGEPIEVRRKFYRITARGKEILVRELRQIDKFTTLAHKIGLLP